MRPPDPAVIYEVPPGAGGDAGAFAGVVLPPEDWARGELARMGFAREPGKKLIAVDPGHGGPEVGSSANGLGEKTVNLAIAQRLKTLLEANGYQVLMVRSTDARAYLAPAEMAGYNALRADLQARVDLANAARADLWISVHNNGSGNRAESGTEVWYDPERPFGHENFRLANAVLEGITGELRAAGHNVVNRGLKDASHFRVFQGRSFSLFVLGNPRSEPRRTRATQMPGVLGESLFMSNPTEGALLAEERIQQAIARGYLAGVNAYFGR